MTKPTDDLYAITAAAVERKRALFAAYGAWQEPDLIDHCLTFAREAAKKVDPAKGALSTFVTRVVECRLYDLAKKLGRERKREVTAARDADYRRTGRAFEDVDDTLPLAEWVGQVYRQAVHTVGREPKGRGPRYLEAAQESTLLAIKLRLRLSNRAMISLLEDTPTLVRSIRLKRLPSREKFRKMWHGYSWSAANNPGRNRSRMAKKVSDWVDEAEAARIVGLSRSKLKSWRLTKQSPFRIFRPGGLTRYDPKDLAAYIKANTTEPVGVKA